jgi:hypothetical protein
MRSYQVFASMSPERAVEMMRVLAEEAPAVFAQAIAAASLAMKARPVYLQRQPFEKQAEAARRALSRVTSNPVAGEVLAVYFLECRNEILVEWLDTLGLAHEEGTLEADEPAPPPQPELRKALESFLAVDDDPDRRLLLAAFAAQDAIDWPDLETLLAADS